MNRDRMEREGAMPVIPLPNPGEGGPVDDGSMGEGIPLPDTDVGGGDNTPLVPLPNPGEGGPVYPGNGDRIPCEYCGISGRIRFLHAAAGYPALRIYVQGISRVNRLDYAGLTRYIRAESGYRTVTVAGEDGYIYIQKMLPIRQGAVYTAAVVRTAGGIDLLLADDSPCARPGGGGCIRAMHLAYAAPAVNVQLGDGRVVYSDLRYKEIPVYKRIRSGNYRFYITESTPIQPRDADIETEGTAVGSAFVSDTALAYFDASIRPGIVCTAYLLDQTSEGGLRIVVSENVYG